VVRCGVVCGVVCGVALAKEVCRRPLGECGLKGPHSHRPFMLGRGVWGHGAGQWGGGMGLWGGGER